MSLGTGFRTRLWRRPPRRRRLSIFLRAWLRPRFRRRAAGLRCGLGFLRMRLRHLWTGFGTCFRPLGNRRSLRRVPLRRGAGCRPRSGSFVRRSDGPRRYQSRRMPAAGFRKLRAVGGSLPCILNLSADGWGPRVAHHGQLLRRGPGVDSTMSAVVTHPIAPAVRHRVVVNVVNNRNIHIRHRSVVIHGAVVPICAVIATAGVSKAVIDSAIKSNVRAPVAGVPEVGVVDEFSLFLIGQRGSADPLRSGGRLPSALSIPDRTPEPDRAGDRSGKAREGETGFSAGEKRRTLTSFLFAPKPPD